METTRSLEIRMPQMTNNSLSEYWLLKELGDIHWSLLSLGFEQKSSEFRDNLNNRIYAAFVRIKYEMNSLNCFLENEFLDLHGEIRKIRSSAYYSTIKGVSSGNQIRASLVSNFTTREKKDNSRMYRGILNEKINHIRPSVNDSGILDEYQLLKKNMLSMVHSERCSFQVTDDEVAAINYSINPYYEINGVGLLYFACFPIIVDKCTADYFNQLDGSAQYASSYHTIYRDIFYFANCNVNDSVVVKLNSIEKFDRDKLKIISSLYRRSDNVLMSRQFAIKQEVSSMNGFYDYE